MMMLLQLHKTKPPSENVLQPIDDLALDLRNMITNSKGLKSERFQQTHIQHVF